MARENRYYFPVAGGRYTNDWGAGRSGGRRHEGTDIFAPRGTAIQAMIGGRVVKSFSNALGGITVRIIGDDGLYYYYTHMEKVASGLKIGQKVHSGQLIGYVGTSGNAKGTPPHLHLGIYRGAGGKAINPYNMLRTAIEAPKAGTYRDEHNNRLSAIDQFMAAIQGQESGGDPNVTNGDSGAHGLFQIMPANWAPWSRETFGRVVAKTAANQRAVAKFKMQQYYRQFGSWQAVAVAWYAGPGAAAAYVKNPGASRFTAKQGKYPSIASYVSQVMARMGNLPSEASAETRYSQSQARSAGWQRAYISMSGGGGRGMAGGVLRIDDGTVQLSPEELAEQYGWAAGLLNSDPELKKLFRQAVAGQWTSERFTAKLRTTKWFRSRSEAARNYDTLRRVDPGQFKAMNEQAQAQVQDLAAQMGAALSGKQLQTIASQMARLGLTEAQVRNALAGYVRYNKAYGGYLGEAGQNEDAIREVAYRNGVRISDSSMQGWMTQIANGNRSAEDFQKWIRTQAASAFPGLADQLNAGMDLADIASPYVETMGNVLEINPADVDLFDPTIRRALASKGADGKPAVQSIWEFENTLRKDKRWVQTNGARESIMEAGQQVLRDWGFSG